MSAYAYKNKAQSKSQQRAFFGGSAAVFSKPGTCTGFARHRLLCMGGLGWFRVIKVPPGPAGSRSVRRSQGKKSNYRRSFKLGQPTLTRVSSLLSSTFPTWQRQLRSRQPRRRCQQPSDAPPTAVRSCKRHRSCNSKTVSTAFPCQPPAEVDAHPEWKAESRTHKIEQDSGSG